MPRINLTPKTALFLFILIAVTLFAQATWWIMFMARLLDEKVAMAEELGADAAYIEQMHEQEISRQMMVGMEGVFFLLLVGVGAWLIYRALVKNEELKFHQQNFLMAVTHELKTPLASMKIYLDTLTSTKVTEEKKANIIPRLKEDIRRLERLVENILEAGRFERSGYQLRQEWFNLTSVLDEAVRQIVDDHRYESIEVVSKKVEPSVQYYGDSGALLRALEAILENCVKYSDKKPIRIELELYTEKNELILAIADNGVGLKKEDTALIFNRFYRVGYELNRSRPGTGLGLFLCREIIKAHGGRITAHSEGIGKGARFVIKLKVPKQDENNTIS